MPKHDINPKDVIRIEHAIHRYNAMKASDEPTMDKQTLARIIYPTKSDNSARSSLSFILNGQIKETKPLTPSQIKKICEVLKCDANLLFQEP